jgi:hypothetical protein
LIPKFKRKRVDEGSGAGKAVVDYNVKVRVKSDGSGVELSNVKMSMNPFDEIAVEEALRLREAGKATEVVVVSIGPPRRPKPSAPVSPWAPTAVSWSRRRAMSNRWRWRKILKAIVDEEKPGLVILGKQAIDDDSTRPARCWPRCSVVAGDLCLQARSRRFRFQGDARRSTAACRPSN